MRIKNFSKCKFIIILIFLIMEIDPLSAQVQLPDRTIPTLEYIDELIKNLPQENNLQFDTSSVDLSAKLSIAVYIVRDNKGQVNINLPELAQSISFANTCFKHIGLSFSVLSIQYVDDYNYSYLSLDKKPVELFKKHSVDKTINLYLVDSISIDSLSSFGFTYFPIDTQDNYIFLRKNFLKDIYLTCMLGHFFGLLSTHDITGGLELVDESNCSTKGDLICDTYADPNIFGLVNNQCLFKGTKIDPQGEYYVPSVANFMSNSPWSCRCVFSKQQYRRMFFYYKKFRQYLR
jgi:hypothetical protein